MYSGLYVCACMRLCLEEARASITVFTARASITVFTCVFGMLHVCPFLGLYDV